MRFRAEVMTTCLILLCGTVWAGRPLTVDDPYPVGMGQCEIETGVAFLKDGDCRHWDGPVGVTFGLPGNLEAGLAFGGQHEQNIEEDGSTCKLWSVNDLNISAKYQVPGEAITFGAHALVASVKLPIADESKGLGSGKTDYDLMWVMSWPMGESYSMHGNLGILTEGREKPENYGKVLHFGLAAELAILERMQLVGEVFGGDELESDDEIWLEFNSGLRWQHSDAITLDLAAGSALNGEAPELTLAGGITWSFGISGDIR